MPERDQPGQPQPAAGSEPPDAIEVVVENSDLLRRLESEYADRIPQATIASAVAQAEHRLATARIKIFVPLLVERHSRETLRAHRRASTSRASA